ncbi:cell division protein FtsL [Pediococcus ethanolidurans]|uniref:cell division protein FtsL n=1 Tax=Pediococcus ethanolidurans TaxID=319653 RepID=UPI001C1EAA00|nr:cell division protein FtsL [Pediococcus ethanolidurans]MBU7554922.1 cell division protein FtsL [Pediococcus ethanolidurans]MCV3320703.1 cell division protein FtsL [Pediococcus ethanolidurans]MCV3327665.1 cell division protein FtsL [Pediococcus ethanolidurans]
MAQNNLAEAFPASKPVKRRIPDIKEGTLYKAKAVAIPKSLPFSKFEKILMTFCGIILTGLMIFVVSGKIALSSAEHDLSSSQAQVTKVTSDNSNLKQEVNQLSSRTRLNKIAKQYGLSLTTQNIRNVNK